MSVIDGFRLPKYSEIPGVGLFLEQVAKYINECLAPLHEPELTGSMISNYVKKGIIANPIKKQYGREQIAYLMFIAVTKTVLSLEDINKMISLQRQVCDVEEAYEYFSNEFIRMLNDVFDGNPQIPILQASEAELPIRQNTIRLSQSVFLTAAHKVYLDYSFCDLEIED